MLIQDLQNRYTGIHPDFWEELNELIEFERQYIKEFYRSLLIEIYENSNGLDMVEDYEDLLEEYDQLAEECDNLHQTIDILKLKLEEAEAVADERLLEIIKLKTINIIDDNKTIKFGF